MLDSAPSLMVVLTLLGGELVSDISVESGEPVQELRERARAALHVPTGFSLRLLLGTDELRDGEVVPENAEITGNISVIIAPAQIAVSGHQDGSLAFWEVSPSSMRCGKRADAIPGAAPIRSLSIDMEADRVVAGSVTGEIFFWSVSTLKCLERISGHSSTVEAIAADFQGETMVSASADGMLRIWQMGSLAEGGHTSCIGVLQGLFQPSVSVMKVDFSRQRLISGSRDGMLRTWDLHEQRSIAGAHVTASLISSVETDFQAGVALCGGSGGEIFFWDLSTQNMQELAAVHMAAVCMLRLGRRWPVQGGTDQVQELWSASVDGSICLWDLQANGFVTAMRSLHEPFGDARRVLMAADAELQYLWWMSESGHALLQPLGCHREALQVCPAGGSLVTAMAM